MEVVAAFSQNVYDAVNCPSLSASKGYAAKTYHHPDFPDGSPELGHRRDVCHHRLAGRQGHPLPGQTVRAREPSGGIHRHLPHRCLPGPKRAVFSPAGCLIAAVSKRDPRLFTRNVLAVDDGSRNRPAFSGRQYRAAPPTVLHPTTTLFTLLHPDLLNPAAPDRGHT